MKAGRLVAIVFIYLACSVAWLVLGAANHQRSSEMYNRLEEGTRSSMGSARAGVQDLWGQPQTQSAPAIKATRMVKQTRVDAKGQRSVVSVPEYTPVIPLSSRISTSINLEPRRKGLLWYSTYRVRFAGDYVFKNEFADRRDFTVVFRFPADQAVYDNVILSVNGSALTPAGDLSAGVRKTVSLAPGQTAAARMSYDSQGMDTWCYRFGSDSSAPTAVTTVRDFKAKLNINASDVDFPQGTVSPTAKRRTADGWEMNWDYVNLVSGFNIGVQMPEKLNPGPLAARLSFFAPVSLLFFFAVLLIIGAVRGIRLHPMHYAFLAAGFFAFHLLFSYVVDHLTPMPAFLIAAAVSLVLVISYVRLVVDWRFAVLTAGLWQFVFLVLFAYAFFFEGYTGLTITIGAIVTLAVMMQLTGRVNWEEALASNSAPPPPLPPAPPGG